MVRFGLFHDIIKAPWSDVTIAFWCKYPNPHSPHVLAEDVITRSVDADTNILHTTRLLKKKGKKPKWMNRFIGESPAIIVEESILDPNAQTFTTYTKNITLNAYMTVEEKCTYHAVENNPDWTSRSIEVRVTSPLFSMGTLVEKFGIDRFKAQSEQAKQALHHVLETMRTSNGGRALGSLRTLANRSTAHCEN